MGMFSFIYGGGSILILATIFHTNTAGNVNCQPWVFEFVHHGILGPVALSPFRFNGSCVQNKSKGALNNETSGSQS